VRHFSEAFHPTCWIIPALLVLCAAAVAGGPAAPHAKKIVFLAGNKSHGPGEHEYELGCRLLARCLETSPSLNGYRTEVFIHGWPQDPGVLGDADAIVVFCDGADHREADHPLFSGERLAALARQMKRGAGLVALHYTLFVPNQRGGPEFLDWLGGYFDFESGAAANHWYSKIQTAQATASVVSPEHPIARGLPSFPLRDEYYYHLRFRENDARFTPILKVALPGEAQPETVAWAVQREGGGRGFAYSGGHFHANWQNENLRRLVLNAIVWAAHGEVPAGGVNSNVAPAAAPSPSPAPPASRLRPQTRRAESVDWPFVGNDAGAMRYCHGLGSHPRPRRGESPLTPDGVAAIAFLSPLQQPGPGSLVEQEIALGKGTTYDGDRSAERVAPDQELLPGDLTGGAPPSRFLRGQHC
jgi:type 1 glutamine amidotransferase